jgi:hypothetical protein
MYPKGQFQAEIGWFRLSLVSFAFEESAPEAGADVP